MSFVFSLSGIHDWLSACQVSMTLVVNLSGNNDSGPSAFQIFMTLVLSLSGIHDSALVLSLSGNHDFGPKPESANHDFKPKSVRYS